MVEVVETPATGRGVQKPSAEIVDRLEEEIALGILHPRERLVEEDLMSRFGVKRHIIRQALADLEAMGIVVRQPNKGAAVRDFRPTEVRHLYEVRELVERRAAELIPMPAPDGLVDCLKAIHARHCEAAAAGDLRTVFRENLKFHRVLFAACGNPALVEVIEQFARNTHAIRSYAIGDAKLLKNVCKEHADMIAAIELRRRDELVRLVTRHIAPAKEAYLRQVESIGLLERMNHRSQ